MKGHNLVSGHIGIRSSADNFNILIFGKFFGKDFPHHGGIVNNQYFYFFYITCPVGRKDSDFPDDGAESFMFLFNNSLKDKLITKYRRLS